MTLAAERLRTPDGRPLLLFAPGTGADSVAMGAAHAGPPAERRRNELRGEDVLYGAHRQDRTFLPPAGACPLCPTVAGAPGPPTEIPRDAFDVAVFPNRFPALTPPAGDAEVVVYTDRHEGSLAVLAPDRAELLVRVWRHRVAELGARPDVAYVMPFENRGEEVGVTLHHPHGQIYAFPFLPPVPAAERAADVQRGACTPCALLAREEADGERVVWRSDLATAYVPWAARWPYEVHLVLRTHRPSLVEGTEADLDALAAGLRAVVGGLDALWDRPMPYVMCVHQAPTDGGGDGHVHVEFSPARRAPDRLKFLAGCEQGAGTFLNDRLPEASAAELREAIARDA